MLCRRDLKAFEAPLDEAGAGSDLGSGTLSFFGREGLRSGFEPGIQNFPQPHLPSQQLLQDAPKITKRGWLQVRGLLHFLHVRHSPSEMGQPSFRRRCLNMEAGQINMSKTVTVEWI